MTQSKKIRIGLFGGTFDPIHCGHLIIAEEIRELCNLDKIIFVPTGLPPHKTNRKLTDAEHRYNMICSAIASNPEFEVSRVELDRAGYTYTIDTLKQFKITYGQDSELFFIIGADVILDLLTWKQYRQVFSMCEFTAAIRPGFDKEILSSRIKDLQTTYNAKIQLVETSLINISSTDIRQRVSDNRTVRYHVPESVLDYINKYGLYLNLQ